MSVFVLDRSGGPLMPCTEKRARLLLARGRARVHRLIPFAIRLIDRRAAECAFQPLQLKLDPGSKTTGIALVRLAEHINVTTGEVRIEVAVLSLFELIHRGRQISEALMARRQMRRRLSTQIPQIYPLSGNEVASANRHSSTAGRPSRSCTKG